MLVIMTVFGGKHKWNSKVFASLKRVLIEFGECCRYNGSMKYEWGQ